jgi:hypothetical protein
VIVFIFLLPIFFISRNVYLFVLDRYVVVGKFELIMLYSFIFSFLFLLFYGIWKALLPLICRYCTNKNYSCRDIQHRMFYLFSGISNKFGINISSRSRTAFSLFQDICIIPTTLLTYSIWANSVYIYILLVLFCFLWFKLSCVINAHF